MFFLILGLPTTFHNFPLTFPMTTNPDFFGKIFQQLLQPSLQAPHWRSFAWRVFCMDLRSSNKQPEKTIEKQSSWRSSEQHFGNWNWLRMGYFLWGWISYTWFVWGLVKPADRCSNVSSWWYTVWKHLGEIGSFVKRQVGGVKHEKQQHWNLKPPPTTWAQKPGISRYK